MKRHFDARLPPAPKSRPPFVYCSETIQGWTRVELPDMDQEAWTETKEWIVDQGFVHRVYGRPKPPGAIQQLNQAMGQPTMATLYKAMVRGAIMEIVGETLRKMAFDMGVNPDEPLAISFKDENAALLFKMRWVG